MTLVRRFGGYAILALLFVGAVALHATQDPLRPLWETNPAQLIVWAIIGARVMRTEVRQNPRPLVPYVASLVAQLAAGLAAFELGALALHSWALTQPWIAPVVLAVWLVLLGIGAVLWVTGQQARVAKALAAAQVVTAVATLTGLALVLHGDLPPGLALLSLVAPIAVYALERMRRNAGGIAAADPPSSALT